MSEERARLNDGTLCARCGKPAQGLATINDERYCHGDYTDAEPTCYMLTLWDRARASSLTNESRNNENTDRGAPQK